LRTETLKPTQTEEEAALVEAFYQRVLEAEKILPRHVPLRLFRHGAECGEFLSLLFRRVERGS
jgi:truncated hemoglobin YjbI